MSPVQMFRGSHINIAKDSVLLGCDTHLLSAQFPIFQTTHCLHVQGVKQSNTNTVTTLHCTLQPSVMWHYIVAQAGPDAPEECSSFTFRVKQHDSLTLLTKWPLQTKMCQPQCQTQLAQQHSTTSRQTNADRNVGHNLPNNTPSHHGRLVPSAAPVWEPQIS
jgi:hypothetical protein